MRESSRYSTVTARGDTTAGGILGLRAVAPCYIQHMVGYSSQCAGVCACCRRYHGAQLVIFDEWCLCYPCYDFVRSMMDPYYGLKHAQG